MVALRLCLEDLVAVLHLSMGLQPYNALLACPGCSQLLLAPDVPLLINLSAA